MQPKKSWKPRRYDANTDANVQYPIDLSGNVKEKNVECADENMEEEVNENYRDDDMGGGSDEIPDTDEENNDSDDNKVEIKPKRNLIEETGWV